ncbi:MAG: response regulator [Kiritimatiellae bacterium]|nr:response regulator [Kiritimatiellia bacterium]
MSARPKEDASALQAELRRLRQSDDAKARILEVLGRVTAQETVDDICRAIVEGVREGMGFDRVGLFIWDDGIDWFRGTFGTGLEGETVDERHIIWDIQPAYHEQIKQGAVFVRGCVLGEPHARPGEEGLKADLMALRRGGRLYGVLSVDNRISRRPITEAELQPLTLLSQVLGNAVELSRARAALARSEERFRQVAESSGEWIWEMDAEGRYTYASPMVGPILGYTPQDVVGRSYAEFLFEEGRDQVIEAVRDAFSRRGKIERLNSRQVHRDGRAVFFETFAIPLLNAEGGLAGYRGVHRDMTRERELETQLRYAQRMEAVGRLAGGIAHDFNNILTSILGCVGLLLDEISEGDPIRPDVEQIRTAGERAAALTRQLLAFSRRQMLSIRPIDLNALVHDMGALLRRVMGEEIELVTDLAARLGPVYADPDQLQQVVLQLAVNACEAMIGLARAHTRAAAGPPPTVRRLTIRTGETVLDEAYCREELEITPGRYATLVMADTGVGMREEVREHLFDPFFTTREFGRGSGLGLATIYGIVKQMKGHIDVESKLGKGTIFTLYLPCVEVEDNEMPSESPGADEKQGAATILVVEDEEPIRRLMARMLQMKGYRALMAADGTEALTVCEEHADRIDLIITDIIMPKLSGKQLVQELKKKRKDFKVIFMSGYSSEDTVDGEPLGVEVAFIPKPFTQEVLARKVSEMLGK